MAVVGVLLLLALSHGYVAMRSSAYGYEHGSEATISDAWRTCKQGGRMFESDSGDYFCAKGKRL